MFGVKMDNAIGFKHVEQVYWQDKGIRAEFNKVNPRLAKIIDSIDPEKKLPLLKVSYNFGDQILRCGKFVFLENIKNNLDILGAKITKTLVDQLSYSPVPFGIFLNKSCETYVKIKDRLVPLFVLSPGRTIGLFEALNIICGIESKPIWDVTAGARSIFMLAKINNNLWHKRLVRQFNITTQAPTSVVNQWDVFVDLARATKSDWQCDILFFTKEWIKHLSDCATGWTHLREYLFKECWLMSGSSIEKSFSFMWQQFAMSTIRRNYKPRIYITDTIRHLIGIAYGIVPAFVPSTTEVSAPVNLIKSAYDEVYNLPYAPILLEPAFIKKPLDPVYYSLGYPSLLEGNPEVSNIYNTISDLKEIKLLLENMYDYYHGAFDQTNKFEHLINKASFKYFHKAPDKQREIQESKRIAELDKRFCEPQTSSQKPLCDAAPFLNGCIAVEDKY